MRSDEPHIDAHAVAAQIRAILARDPILDSDQRDRDSGRESGHASVIRDQIKKFTRYRVTLRKGERKLSQRIGHRGQTVIACVLSVVIVHALHHIARSTGMGCANGAL